MDAGTRRTERVITWKGFDEKKSVQIAWKSEKVWNAAQGANIHPQNYIPQDYQRLAQLHYLHVKSLEWASHNYHQAEEQRPPSSSLSYPGPGNDDVRSPGSGGTPGPLSQQPGSQQSVDNTDPVTVTLRKEVPRERQQRRVLP
uniref:Uncharacterized protein n=1 Tax=Timema poppense TaxID=170557 RepID=A0A7R9H6A8_TIMPO|nr:unnamed protein product [Timema poppensis]